MRAIAALDALLLAQRGHLFPWVPVFLGAGVGIFFALRTEPEIETYIILSLLAGFSGLMGWRAPDSSAALGWAVMLAAAGFCLAGYRAHNVSAAVLSYRYYGPVEGRVVAIDRSASDAVRLTLDQVRLRKMFAQRNSTLMFHDAL